MTTSQLSYLLPSMPLESDKENLADLPQGWEWRSLNDRDVCYLNPKRSEASSLPDDLDVSFVPMAALDAIQGAITQPESRKLGEVRKGGFTYFAEGDVLFAKITPCMENGKSAIARNLQNDIGFGTTELHVLRPGPLVIAEWLYFFVRQKSFREEAAAHFTGSAGQQRVPVQFLMETFIPIPPVPEQLRIVGRIKAFTQRMEETQILRSEAAGWVDSLMPETRWQVFDALLNGGVRKYTLHEVTSFLGRGRSTQQGSSEFRLIKTRHVYPKGLKPFDDCRLSDQEAARCSPERILQPGDVLVCSSAAGCLGRPSFFAGYSNPCTTDSHVAIVRSTPGLLDPGYLFHYFQSPQGQFELLSREQGGKWQEEKVGFRLTELNLADLRTVPVPMPPLDEQRQVAAYLDGLQAKADAIRATQAATQKELDALLPAVLDRAFRGEL